MQVTYFEDGSTCLGITIPHLLADLDTCKTIISTWAKEYTILEKQHDQSPSQTGYDNNGNPDVGARDELTNKSNEMGANSRASDLGNIGDSDRSNSSNSDLSASSSYGSISLNSSHRTNSNPCLLADILPNYLFPSLPSDFESTLFEKRKWTFIPKAVGAAVWHLGGSGGVTTVAYHVPSARLSELKQEASNALSAESCNAMDGNSMTRASPAWISTNDALLARLWQVMAQLTPKSSSQLFLSVNLRKRLSPALPSNSLGNCAWSLHPGNGKITKAGSADLGSLAVAVRTSIQSIDKESISKEMTWLSQNVVRSMSIPVVITDVLKLLSPAGNIVASNWDWDKNYESVAFGSDGHPVWHQAFQTRSPNTAFIIPAPSAAPGGGCFLFITLHKNLANELRSKFPSL